MNHSEMVITASWDLRLVALSYIVAVFASYTALDLAGRVVATRGWARRIWLFGGAFAMGTGIWSMHFTGMQAFKMPMAVTYDVLITLLSMVIAIAASALALFVVSRGMISLPQLLIAGSVMGIGIASMHYTGMVAMQMPATISYDPLLFTLSVLIAIVASIAALRLAFRFSIASNTSGRWQWTKGGSALVMGAAIVGMHYTGMAAANFVSTGTAVVGSGIDTTALGFGIGVTTLAILGIALVSSIVNRKFSVQATELEKTERHYESLFRHNPDAVYSLDLEGRFLTANLTTVQMLGYQTQELRQKLFTDFIIDAEYKEARRHFEEAVRGEPQNYEVTITDKIGKRVDLSVTSIPIVVEGEIVGVYGIAKNITEHKRAEEARSQLATIVESSDDAIFGRTLDNTISTWNGGAERLFGYTAEEAIGQTSSIILPPDRREELTEILARAKQGESTSHYETVRTTKDGKLKDVSLTVSPIMDSEGNIVASSTIARDITERKRAEEELRQAYEELDLRVQERTAELAEANLALQERMEDLQRSNAELEQFAYVASHDLQEPLRMVSSYTQLLGRRYRGQLDEAADEFINYAVDGANRMQTLISDLLQYSRVGTQGKPLAPTDAGTVFETARINLRMAIEDSGAEITSDPLPTIMSDESQLVQLLQNLIANAIKFRREERTPEVHVGAERLDGEWLFSVRDNGIGIEEQYLERIFDLPAVAWQDRVLWHRDRTGGLQEDRGAPWRQDLGRVRAR